MISWIQKYFQRHFKTVFAVLLAVTIISFIFTIGASPGIGRGDRQILAREFFGYNLSLADDQQRLMGDAQLSASLQIGSLGGLEAEQIQNYAFQRAAQLYLADQWHIPPATPSEIKDAIQKLRMFAGPNGEFDAKAYQTFRDNLKTNPRGLTEADIARVIGDDVRAEKVSKLLSGPGYVLPSDVKKSLERADTTWTLATATADYAAFKVDVKPTDAEIAKFFEENSFRYEIPPRVLATYVSFPTMNYMARVSVTDAEVRAYYDANPARFPKPPEVKAGDAKAPVVAPKTSPDADFAAVRPQVETAVKLEKAQKLASKDASDFALALYEAKLPNNGPALDAFLSARKMQAKTLAPFSRESGPKELGGSAEIADEAFKLNKDHFASEALTTPTGAVILFWKETQPAHKPQLAEVKEKVAADYVDNQKQKRFVELGKTIKTQLESRLKAGEPFDKAVAAVSSSTGVKLEPKTLPPFSLRTRPQDVDYSILGQLEHLNKGQVSDMTLNGDKGLIVYAADKKLPDLSESNPKYAEMRTQLAAYASRLGANAYIAELVSNELKKSEPKAD